MGLDGSAHHGLRRRRAERALARWPGTDRRDPCLVYSRSVPAIAAHRTIRAGLDRPETPYAWPPSLLAQPGELPLVYLDLNHWIYLAKAATGHRTGTQFQPALEALRHAAGRVVIPLSSVHYMEMGGIADPRRRFDVASVMEELSGFVCVMPRSTIMEIEIEAALADAIGTEARFGQVRLLGWGALQAWGRRGGLRVHSETDGDVTAKSRQTWPGGPAAFDAWTRGAELLLARSVLRGPTDEEALPLQGLGWDPTVAGRIAEDRARSEREQAARFDAEPRYRRGRLRDVVSARYLGLELLPRLEEALRARGLGLPGLFADRDQARRFTDSMPSGDAWISLVTAAHRNPRSRWQSNDIFDFDALSVAIPYCDLVVTDRHACRLANTTRLPKRMGTRVFATLDELVRELRDLF